MYPLANGGGSTNSGSLPMEQFSMSADGTDPVGTATKFTSLMLFGGFALLLYFAVKKARA